MTGDGRFVEVQSTAEKVPFDRARLDELLDLAAAGIEDLAAVPGGGDRCTSRLAPIPTLSDLGRCSLRLVVACGLGGCDRLRARDPRPRGRDPHASARLRSARRSSRSSPRSASTTFLSASRPNVLVRLDPSRIAAQIVTGIGFLGAGAIIREGLSVRGLTTAGSLWVVAAIGMARGAGLVLAGGRGDGADASSRSGRCASDRLQDHRADQARGPPHVVELKEGAAARAALRRRSARTCASFEISDELDRRVVQLELTRHRRGARRAALRPRLRDRRPVAALIATVCTANPHKLEEFARALPRLGSRRSSKAPSSRRRTARPTSTTRASRRATAGSSGPRDRWMLADDSGIEVAALGQAARAC